MAGIFKKAYDQTDRILNGSGLSPIVYRQDGGISGLIGSGETGFYQQGDLTNALIKWFNKKEKKKSDKKPRFTKRKGYYQQGDFTKKLLDYLSGLKHGGQTMPRGLSNINMIKRELGGGLSGEPRTIAEAKERGKTYFINKHGEKLAAVTREDLERTGLSLTEYINKQNTFNKLMQSITPGLKPIQDLPTPIQEKEIKERDYRIINPLLDKRIKYSQQQDINNPPTSSLTDEQWRDTQARTARGVLDLANEGLIPMGDAFRSWSAAQGAREGQHDFGVERDEGRPDLGYADSWVVGKTGGPVSGGISNIKKSININGQPHSLAWINPGEASALKAMGGSGKKGPMGIPSYQETDEYDYSVVDSEPATVEMYDMGFTETVPGYFTHETEPEDIGNIITYTQPYTPVATSDSGDTWQEERAKIIKSSGTGGGRGADPRAFTYYREPIEDKGPAGGVPYYGGSDPLTKEDFLQGRYSNKLIPYINSLYASGMITDQVGDYIASLSPTTLAGMREAYDTGYSFGGPMGTMRGLSRDQGTGYAKKLKLKKLTGKETKKEKEKYLSDLKERIENLGGEFILSHKFQGLYGDKWKDTLKSHGFADPVTGELTTMGTAMDWLKPFSMISKAGAMGLNALTSAFGVLGEFITPEGQSYRLMDDGTLVEPDIYADTDEGNVPVTRRPRPRPVQQVSVSEEVEKPLTGIAKLLDEREDTASKGKELQPQFDNIIAAGFSRQEAADMLNQPVNIFAQDK